jgi:hypothetical protein
MKKLLTIVLTVVSMQIFAQTYPITGINILLPSSPDANTANWGAGASLFMISAAAQSATGRVDPAVEESKMLVIIKKGGSKICGAYTSSTAPAADFNTLTKVWSGNNAASFLGQDCKLPPGDYELSVQFFGYSNGKTVALSDEKTKQLTIKGNDQQAYQPPQAIAPADGTALSEADIKKPITFRWTPIVPKPQEPVTYRLSVWQLMQGQTGVQAMKANTPIITKDVDNITQAIITNIVDGPCKPPLMCDFIWNVQALNRDGKPIGGNNGLSEALGFNVKAEPGLPQGDLKISLISPIMELKQGDLRPAFQWKVNSSEPGQSYSIKVVEMHEKQSPEDAIKTNTPILEEKGIKETSFPYPSSVKPIAPGKKYAWFVTIWDERGKQHGQSAPAQFSAGGCDVQLTMKLLSVTCLPATKGNNNYKICVSSTYTSSVYNLTYANAGSGFKAYPPSYSPTYAVSNITPGLQVQNSGSATTLNYCFDVSVPAGQTAIKVGLQGDDKDPGPIVCQPGAELDVVLPPCTCTICDQYKDWSFSRENVTATTAAPYTVNVDAIFNAPNVIIKSFKAELISFVHNGTEACFGCNKDAETFGNFTKGKFASWGYGVFPLDGTNTTHHTLTWFSATGATVNLSGQPISIQFTAPPISPLSCCDDEIDFCIRYSFTDTDCRTCSYVKCYTVKRKH